jgi:pyruvate dehydrogenase (quinone)
MKSEASISRRLTPKPFFVNVATCELISQAEQMPRVLDIAIQTALTKRGVAVVVLPGDVALREAISSKPRIHFPEICTTIRSSDEEIARIAGILNDSRKVTIFGGAGCADAHNELIELAGKLNAPIVHALRGKEFIEHDHPFGVGMTGLLGFSSGYRAMTGCDTLLMLGTDFPYQQFYPEKATIIQVDIRGEQIGRLG